MLVTLLLTRLDIVKNSYCYQGGSSIMQALQISHLNINRLITLLPFPPAPNQLLANGSEHKPVNYCTIISAKCAVEGFFVVVVWVYFILFF